MLSAGAPVPLGFAPKNRAVLDTARVWTMVSQAAFSNDGEVRNFQIYSGAAGRRLRVGIYRPSGSTCQFRLIQQKEWASFPVGVNEVSRSKQEVAIQLKMCLEWLNVVDVISYSLLTVNVRR